MSRTSAVPINEMANAISKQISEWTQEIADVTKQAVVETSIEAVRELRQTSPRRVGGGRYANDWDRKVTSENRFKLNQIIYNKKHYRLTHLLEYGHANARGGGRTPAHPHIGQVEAHSMEMLEAKLRRYINDVS